MVTSPLDRSMVTSQASPLHGVARTNTTNKYHAVHNMLRDKYHAVHNMLRDKYHAVTTIDYTSAADFTKTTPNTTFTNPYICR